MKPKTWERQPGEGAKAHAAFLCYRDLGAERTMGAVREQCGKSTGKTPSLRLLERWSARHEWVARCRQWDAHLAKVRDAEVAEAEARAAATWAERRIAQRERLFTLAEALEAKAEGFLKLPLTQQKVTKSEDGRTIAMTIEPARWGATAAIGAARAGAELARAALDWDRPNGKSADGDQGRDGDPPPVESSMSPEQVKALRRAVNRIRSGEPERDVADLCDEILRIMDGSPNEGSEAMELARALIIESQERGSLTPEQSAAVRAALETFGDGEDW